MFSFLFWIVLFSFNITAQTQILPPVQIESDSSQESSRSVLWPVQQERVTPAINLPQIDDALNGLNGLQVRTQGSPTFSIRGSAQNGRALVLYNHIPLNFASGFGAPRIFLPKETLQKIVTIKGPASLFYGSQAMAGAVDFIPKKYTQPELNINFSDTNESFLPGREGRLAHQSWQVASPLLQTKKTHIQASLFHESDDGQFPYQTNNSNGVRDFNSQNLSRISLSATTQFSNLHLALDSLVGRHIKQSPGPSNFSFFTREESEGGLFSITPHYFFSDHQSLRSKISYLQYNSEFLASNIITYSKQTTTILQNEWIYDFSRFSKLQLFADAFFHQMDSSFSGDGRKQDNLEIGPFLSFHSTDFLKHQVGGRYLVKNKKFLPTLSTHLLWNQHDLWISYSEGFRNPTLTDLFSISPQFVANPNLTPEQSQQYELGIKNTNDSFIGDLRWDLRLFLMEYKNFLESFELTPGIYSKENQGEGFSRGFDADIHWTGAAVSAELSYNYLETRSRQQGRPFRLSPKHQFSWSGFYNFSNLKLQVQNTHWYNTIDVSSNQVVKLEDWQQWNFFLHIMAFEQTRISLGLINAFNEGKQLSLNYPEPQRKYWLQIHQKF